MKQLPKHNDFFFRVASSDGMTALTRLAMLLTTILVSLIAWQANQLISQVKDQEAQISTVMVHTLSTDGEIGTLKAISADQGKRIERLEADFYHKGGH